MVIYASSLPQRGLGARLHSLRVMLQINKDATMLTLSSPIRLMQFPYLLTGDVILFQLDPPLPFPTLSLSRSPPSLSPLAAGSFRPIRASAIGKKKKEGGGERAIQGMPARREGRRSANWTRIRELFPGLREQEDWPLPWMAPCREDAKDPGQVTDQEDWLSKTDLQSQRRILIICGLLLLRGIDVLNRFLN